MHEALIEAVWGSFIPILLQFAIAIALQVEETNIVPIYEMFIFIFM